MEEANFSKSSRTFGIFLKLYPQSNGTPPTKSYIRMPRIIRIDKMARPVRKIVRTAYYYGSETDDSDATTVIFDDDDWKLEESEEESGSEEESEVSDSEEGTDYESETEPESDPEELDDPKPYFGKGFRVYFDSHADKKFFMRAFGFYDA